MKETDNFFEEYSSFYPFDKELSIKMINYIGQLGKIKLEDLFLFWFPEHYFLKQKILEILLFPSKGYMPITWKYYLGIMAASTMKCEFLYRYLEEEFLLNGGDEDWLIKGLEIVPEKLKKIDKINNILAHQPWKLTENDLRDLYIKNNSNMWNINEIVEGILILINFYRLAGIIESIKLSLASPKSKLEEFEIFSEEKNENNSLSLSFNFNSEDETKNILISKLESLNMNESSNPFENEKVNLPLNSALNNSDDNIKKNYNFNKINTNVNDSKENNSSHKNNSSFENIVSNEDFGKHISNYCTVYLDFDIHSEEFFSTFVSIYLCLYFFIFLGI